MAESQAAVQARLAEQMQAQERALAKAVEERLADFSKRIGDRLQQSATQSHTTLTDLRERLAVIDRAQKNITELSSQVVGLQDVLSNKQARGAFGEVQMGDIVSSILPPSAYSLQATLTNGKRADCLIRLPNPPGPIAIDSKFPLESYEALRAARDEAEKLQASRAFAAAVRTHVADISRKYIVPGETAESALMFLPSEAVYAELHAAFRGVVEDSYRARVWIVSPTTLMATLNTVRAVLKDVHMREQAGVIQEEVRLHTEGRAAARRPGGQAAAPLRPGRRGRASDPHLDGKSRQAGRAHRGDGIRDAGGRRDAARHADRRAARQAAGAAARAGTKVTNLAIKLKLYDY